MINRADADAASTVAQDAVTETPQLRDASGQQASSAVHTPHRLQDSRLCVGDRLPRLLTASEFRALLGYGRTQFWRLERAGAFTHLLADMGPGVRRTYDGVRIAARLDGARDGEGGDARARLGTAAARRHGGDSKGSSIKNPRKQQREIPIPATPATPATPSAAADRSTV